MSLTGKQSPLGVNTLSSVLLNQGLSINSVVTDYVGSSKYNSDYSPGELVSDTVLKKITYAINNGYKNSQTGYQATLTNCTVTTTRLTVGKLTSGMLQPGQNIYDDTATLIGTLVSQASNEGNGTGGTGSVWIITGGPSPNYEGAVAATLVITGSSTGYRLSNTTYDRLCSIGASRIPALGNSPPPTYLINDPSGNWYGEATTGYPIEGTTGQGQSATWYPWETSNDNSSVTQWGWVRGIALQAWQDFNWGSPVVNNITPEYRWYTQFFLIAEGFKSQSNDAILALRNSLDFLQGSYSNMNDLITADITGISLSTQAFGQDLINLGKAVTLNKIDSFGLPSTLLYTLQQAGAISDSLNITMLGAELNVSEINEILASESATFQQEQKLYNAMDIITGDDLIEILDVLKCKTKGIEKLTDLLNVKKMFPISYTTLTVPIYNTDGAPTNSKIYYLLFVNKQLNPQLLSIPLPKIPPQIPAREPVVVPEPIEPIQTIEQTIINKPPSQPPVAPVIIQASRGGGGGCVVLDAYVPTVEKRTHNDKVVEKAWQLEPSFDILLSDENLNNSIGKVAKALIDYQSCVKIITASGISLSCSTTAPILTKNDGYVEAPKLFGKNVAVMRNDVVFWDEIVSIEDIGYKHVRVIDTGDNSFWAGDIQNAYILHHNVNVYNEFRFDKK